MYDNNSMADNNFTEQLLAALDAKAQWFDNNQLPEMLENYRLLHTCVKSLFDFLLKKSMIHSDPYKNEKKISDITSPENSPFTEAERSMVMGMRFSDYDSTLDFLCNYYRFSVSNLTVPNIRKLIDLNNSIQWNSFSVNSNNTNTRTLATMLLSAKQNCEAITVSMINDSISKAGKAITAINKQLKELTDFQREFYKGNIRKNVYEHPNFDKAKAFSSPADELAQIKKLFTAVMGKIPFYSELIEEIIEEDQGANKAELQTLLLKKLEVSNTKSEKKEVTIDTKEILLTAVRVFGATPGQIMQIAQKIQENHELLESEHNSFWDKFKKVLMKAFNIEEKPTFYQITVTDPTTATRSHEKINFHQFVGELAARARRYNSVCVKRAPGYEKLAQLDSDKILAYVNQQITECQKLMKTLNGMDEFFKNAPQPQNRNRVKGIKMEITALKNSVVKANQHRSEYSAYVEEEAQLKKLGIKK